MNILDLLFEQEMKEARDAYKSHKKSRDYSHAWWLLNKEVNEFVQYEEDMISDLKADLDRKLTYITNKIDAIRFLNMDDHIGASNLLRLQQQVKTMREKYFKGIESARRFKLTRNGWKK